MITLHDLTASFTRRSGANGNGVCRRKHNTCFETNKIYPEVPLPLPGKVSVTPHVTSMANSVFHNHSSDPVSHLGALSREGERRLTRIQRARTIPHLCTQAPS